MTKNELKKLRHMVAEADIKVIEKELIQTRDICYAPSDPEYKRLNKALETLFTMRDATYKLLQIYGLHHL